MIEVGIIAIKANLSGCWGGYPAWSKFFGVGYTL